MSSTAPPLCLCEREGVSGSSRGRKQSERYLNVMIKRVKAVPGKHSLCRSGHWLRLQCLSLSLRCQNPLLILLSHISVTGESPPSLSKELTNSLAGVGDVSFDADTQFPLDELKIDPLTLDGLHMLNDPDMVLADPATEDTFRMDRL